MGVHMAEMDKQLGEMVTWKMKESGWWLISSDWGSMQKRAGTTVSKVIISNTLCHCGLKILHCTQGTPAQSSTCPGPAEVCHQPSERSGGGMGEAHVVR